VISDGKNVKTGKHIKTIKHNSAISFSFLHVGRIDLLLSQPHNSRLPQNNGRGGTSDGAEIRKTYKIRGFKTPLFI